LPHSNQDVIFLINQSGAQLLKKLIAFQKGSLQTVNSSRYLDVPETNIHQTPSECLATFCELTDVFDSKLRSNDHG